MNLYFLLAIFGLAMLMQYSIVRNWISYLPQKAPWIWISAFFLRLFQCSLCMGFHAGWLCYLLLVETPINLRHMVFWALVGAGFVQMVKDLTTKIVGNSLDQ